MGAPKWTEREVGLLIPDEYVGSQFPSTKDIFRVIHPKLQAECMALARRYHLKPSGEHFFTFPQPFRDYRIKDGLYKNWGEEDKSKYHLEWGDRKNIGWVMVLSHYNGLPVMSILNDQGMMSERSTKLTPVGRAIIVSGGLDHAAATEFFECYPSNPEANFPGIGDFYQNRFNLAARRGAFGSRAPRLSKVEALRIVKAYDRLPSSEKIKELANPQK